MSIMTTWEAVPSRLFSLYASLCDAPSGEVREKFEAQATPASLRNKSEEEEEAVATNLFSNALREALAIGLIETNEDKLMITERARSFANASKDREHSFRRFMMDTLLDVEKARTTQQACFMATLAWFLTKSPFRPTGFQGGSDTGPQGGSRRSRGQDRYHRGERLSEFPVLGALSRLCRLRGRQGQRGRPRRALRHSRSARSD